MGFLESVVPRRSFPPTGLSRQALRRWIAIRYAVGVSLGVLLTLGTVWLFTERAGLGIERERQSHALELAKSIAATVRNEEPGLPAAGEALDPVARRELGERLLTLRQVSPEIRSVYLLRRDAATGDWRVLLASSTPGSPRAEGAVFVSTTGAPLFEARQAPTVTSAPATGPGLTTALAPVRDRDGGTTGIAGVDLDTASTTRGLAEMRRDGSAVALALIVGIAAIGSVRFRRRLAELERVRAMQAEISIHRVGDTLARAEKDEDLVRCALDAIAEGSSIAHWAMFLRDPRDGRLALFAVRELPEEARSEIRPDAIARDARSPAARAAWHREVVIVRDPAALPDYAFPALTPGLGPRPVIVAVPLTDGSDTIGVLECYVPRSRRFEPEDLALIRWMATQVSVGLKRIRMERRDQMLASFTMGTGEILLGLDPDFGITHANPAAQAALGVAEGTLIGQRLEAIVAVDPGGAPPWMRAGESGEFSGEIWFVRPKGGRFPAEVRISPTYDRAGARNAMVLVGHDVAERREREIEIANRTQELALLNDQLQRANEDLEEARRMQNEFVANTSHELRTPLNAVIGFATLIEQGSHETEEESREFAGQIRRSAEHLLGLLNDILDLAKVEAGRFELTVSPGDLRGPVRSAVDAISPMALSRGLNLLVDLPLEPLEAHLDAARVRQVMMNLLGNAVKFTDTGEVRVRADRDERTGRARIVVEDTGAGIAPEQRARLFTKFAQIDGSYTRRHAGTGLGLAISKALMQNMGGTITVESEGIGRGTTATLTFPPLESAADRPRRETEESARRGGSRRV
ncbi:MAG TPA: ATP-binding protein [Candidatus Eisenbacteria bacterium]